MDVQKPWRHFGWTKSIHPCILLILTSVGERLFLVAKWRIVCIFKVEMDMSAPFEREQASIHGCERNGEDSIR